MIPVTDSIFLTKLELSDAETINAHMRDKEISDNTLVIPFPYTIQDANTFLEDTAIKEEETGVQKNFAIRDGYGVLMGIIGIHFNFGLDAGKSEFGYWLGKKHWNKGVMTTVINKFCEVAKEKYKMKTLEAYVFYFNDTSMHVLQKCGFACTNDTITHTKRDDTKVLGIGFSKLL